MSEPGPRVQQSPSNLNGPKSGDAKPGDNARKPSNERITNQLRVTEGVDKQDAIVRPGEAAPAPAQFPPGGSMETNNAAGDALNKLQSALKRMDQDVGRIVTSVDTLIGGAVEREAAAEEVDREKKRAARPKEPSLDGLVAFFESATFFTFGVGSAMAAMRRSIGLMERMGNLADTAQGSGAARGFLAGAAESPNLALFNALSAQADVHSRHIEGLQEENASLAVRVLVGEVSNAKDHASAIDGRLAYLPPPLLARSSEVLGQAEAKLAAAAHELQRQLQVLRARHAGVSPNHLRKGSESRRFLDTVMGLAGDDSLLRFVDVRTRHVTVDPQLAEIELDGKSQTMLTSVDMHAIRSLSNIGHHRPINTVGEHGWGFVVEGTDREMLSGAPIRSGGSYVREDIVTAHLGNIVRDLPRAQWEDPGARSAWVKKAGMISVRSNDGTTLGPR